MQKFLICGLLLQELWLYACPELNSQQNPKVKPLPEQNLTPQREQGVQKGAAEGGRQGKCRLL